MRTSLIRRQHEAHQKSRLQRVRGNCKQRKLDDVSDEEFETLPDNSVNGSGMIVEDKIASPDSIFGLSSQEDVKNVIRKQIKKWQMASDEDGSDGSGSDKESDAAMSNDSFINDEDDGDENESIDNNKRSRTHDQESEAEF